MKYKRVLLKLSGEALMGKEKSSKVLDKDVLFNVANQVKTLVDNNVEVCIVIGGGNIFRGKYCEELSIERASADYMGMVATIFNSLAFKASLDALNVNNVVMSALNINQVCEPYYYLKAKRHLENKKVVIFAAGTGNPYFSTDTCAALRASEMNVDVILMAKNGVDGVYNKDPKKYSDATKYDFISYQDVLNKKLEVIDLAAINLCSDNKIKLIVFNMDKENAIIDVASGVKEGTVIGKEN
jgi:uridylate kinase